CPARRFAAAGFARCRGALARRLLSADSPAIFADRDGVYRVVELRRHPVAPAPSDRAPDRGSGNPRRRASGTSRRTHEERRNAAIIATYGRPRHGGLLLGLFGRRLQLLERRSIQFQSLGARIVDRASKVGRQLRQGLRLLMARLVFATSDFVTQGHQPSDVSLLDKHLSPAARIQLEPRIPGTAWTVVDYGSGESRWLPLARNRRATNWRSQRPAGGRFPARHR